MHLCVVYTTLVVGVFMFLRTSAMWNMCVHIEFSILSLPSTKLFVHSVHHPPLTSHHLQVYMTALILASISRAQMRKEAFIIKCSQRCSASCLSSPCHVLHTHTIVNTSERKTYQIHVGIFGIYFLFWALNKGLCQKYKMHETWSNAISGAHFYIFLLNNGHYPNLLKPQNIAMIN